MKNICWAVIFITLSGPSCKHQEVLTKEEVINVIRRFDDGWKNKNAKMVDSVLSPSYIYFTQSGGTFDRKNIVETAGSPDYQLQNMERQQLDMKIEGNTAIVNTIWIGKGVYFNKVFNDTQRCSITVIKNNGKAAILSEHCTLIK